MCRHLGVLFGKNLDRILLRHRILKYPDLPSTRYRMRCGFTFFHSRERIEKYPDTLPNSPDACERKPYPERKSLRIQEYPAARPSSQRIGPRNPAVLGSSSALTTTWICLTVAASLWWPSL